MTKNLGIENYFAYYGLGGKDTIGSSVSMIANIVGAKIAARTDQCGSLLCGGNWEWVI